MAKLSAEVLEEGRALIRQKNLDGFLAWVDRQRVAIDMEVVRDAYEKCFEYDDVDKALRLFEAIFPKADPAADLLLGFSRLALRILLVLGVIGGLIYLIRNL
jgi:hypothetical protein